jgi:hypothetical protein
MVRRGRGSGRFWKMNPAASVRFKGTGKKSVNWVPTQFPGLVFSTFAVGRCVGAETTLKGKF